MGDFYFPNSTILYHVSSSQFHIWKKNKGKRHKVVQCKIQIAYGFHKPKESVLDKASSRDLIHANASSFCVAGLNQGCSGHTKNPRPRGCSHLPQELPPALAGQTEPSPSSWEVWSPSTSYSRAGKAQSLEKQKRFAFCGWKYLLPFLLRKWLMLLSHSCSQEGRKGEPWLHKWARVLSFRTQSSVPAPTARPTHVLLTHSKDFRMGCASALDHPGESVTLRRWGSGSKGLRV